MDSDWEAEELGELWMNHPRLRNLRAERPEIELESDEQSYWNVAAFLAALRSKQSILFSNSIPFPVFDPHPNLQGCCQCKCMIRTTLQEANPF
jgi:hypothetical protein